MQPFKQGHISAGGRYRRSDAGLQHTTSLIRARNELATATANDQIYPTQHRHMVAVSLARGLYAAKQGDNSCSTPTITHQHHHTSLVWMIVIIILRLMMMMTKWLSNQDDVSSKEWLPYKAARLRSVTPNSLCQPHCYPHVCDSMSTPDTVIHQVSSHQCFTEGVRQVTRLNQLLLVLLLGPLVYSRGSGSPTGRETDGTTRDKWTLTNTDGSQL